MNFTETFDQFSSRLSGTDLALYAGVGLVLFILFKDKMSPVQSFLTGLVTQIKTLLPTRQTAKDVVVIHSQDTTTPPRQEDVFFDLVVSWKQTRDLAVKSGCDEAVKVADQMFPFLSPNVCNKE